MSEELEEKKTSWDTQPRRHSLCPQVPGVIRRLETCRDRGILDEVQCVRSARGAAVQVMDRLNKRCRKEAVRLCVHDSPVGTSRATVGRGTVRDGSFPPRDRRIGSDPAGPSTSASPTRPNVSVGRGKGGESAE